MEGLGDLVDFSKRYATERACLKALIDHRWPEGFCCPKCGCRHGYWLKKRRSYECAGCGYQASATASTVLHNTRISIQKWFIAIYLMASTPKAPSATELERQLRVTHKTAWAMRQKIVRTMACREGELMLRGIIEVDESFVGDRERGVRGRQTERKALVAIAVDHTAKGGCRHAHMRMVSDASGPSLTAVAKQNVVPGSTVLTDGWPGYNDLKEHGYDHIPGRWNPRKMPRKYCHGHTSPSLISRGGSWTFSMESVGNTSRDTSMSFVTALIGDGIVQTCSVGY